MDVYGIGLFDRAKEAVILVAYVARSDRHPGLDPGLPSFAKAMDDKLFKAPA